MKKFKIILVLIILGLIGLIIYQNQDYFMTKNSLMLNFYFSEYTVPQAVNGLYWLGCFAVGFLISYFSSLVFRFKAQKKIKLQNQTIENYRETVQELKKEVENIRASGYFSRQKPAQDDLQDEAETTDNEEEIVPPVASPATGA